MAENRSERLTQQQQGLAEGVLIVDALAAIPIKDDSTTMEYPFYTLSKQPDRNPRRYEHRGSWIEFSPSTKGLPTIYDKDLIIFAVSHLVASLNNGLPLKDLPSEVEILPMDFFKFAGKSAGGASYKALADSLDRLKGTTYRTNIKIGGTVHEEWLGIIDKATLKTNEKTGKPFLLRIKLSEQMIQNIATYNVLTLNPSYFELSPIYRRIYELARKHVGSENKKVLHWPIYLSTMYDKIGIRSPLKGFRQTMKKLILANDLPDFNIAWDNEKPDLIVFTAKESFKRSYANSNKKPSGALWGEYIEGLPELDKWAIDKAEQILPAHVSVSDIESDWRKVWEENGKKKLDNHNAAFVGFCKKMKKRHIALFGAGN